MVLRPVVSAVVVDADDVVVVPGVVVGIEVMGIIEVVIVSTAAVVVCGAVVPPVLYRAMMTSGVVAVAEIVSVVSGVVEDAVVLTVPGITVDAVVGVISGALVIAVVMDVAVVASRRPDSLVVC